MLYGRLIKCNFKITRLKPAVPTCYVAGTFRRHVDEVSGNFSNTTEVLMVLYGCLWVVTTTHLLVQVMFIEFSCIKLSLNLNLFNLVEVVGGYVELKHSS